MQVGDDVYVYRRGSLPSWFRWQGLPGTIIKIEGIEASVRMPDGNNVGFRLDELTEAWPPSGFGQEPTISAPPYPMAGPETTGSVGSGPRSMDPERPYLIPRGRWFYDTRCSCCKNAVDEGWFGLSDAGHCPRQKPDGEYCHATFTGNAQHCVMCHRTFGSEAAANRHKSGLICLDPARVRNRRGVKQFGEPRLNTYGTLVWRLVARTDSPWQK